VTLELDPIDCFTILAKQDLCPRVSTKYTDYCTYTLPQYCYNYQKLIRSARNGRDQNSSHPTLVTVENFLIVSVLRFRMGRINDRYGAFLTPLEVVCGTLKTPKSCGVLGSIVGSPNSFAASMKSGSIPSLSGTSITMSPLNP